MIDPTDEQGSFLRRWSRLKRQEPEAPLPATAAPVEPDEIPPPAETIPLEDIAGWMGRRLPEGWREIALRRVWSADTAIRDFVGLADYDWDWNLPVGAAGAAPGWGPLRATDDMVRLLARAIGEPEPPPDPALAAPEAAPEAAPVIAALETPAPPFEGGVPTPVAVAIEVPPAPNLPPRRGGKAAPV